MYVVHCKPYENTCMRLIIKTQCLLAIKYTIHQLNKMQIYNSVTEENKVCLLLESRTHRGTVQAKIKVCIAMVKMYTRSHGGILVALYNSKPCTIRMGILLLSAGGPEY